jgi:hypothetical protein
MHADDAHRLCLFQLHADDVVSPDLLTTLRSWKVRALAPAWLSHRVRAQSDLVGRITEIQERMSKAAPSQFSRDHSVDIPGAEDVILKPRPPADGRNTANDDDNNLDEDTDLPALRLVEQVETSTHRSVCITQALGFLQIETARAVFILTSPPWQTLQRCAEQGCERKELDGFINRLGIPPVTSRVLVGLPALYVIHHLIMNHIVRAEPVRRLPQGLLRRTPATPRAAHRYKREPECRHRVHRGRGA